MFAFSYRACRVPMTISEDQLVNLGHDEEYADLTPITNSGTYNHRSRFIPWSATEIGTIGSRESISLKLVKIIGEIVLYMLHILISIKLSVVKFLYLIRLVFDLV